MDKNFEVISRGIIVNDGKILLCHSKGNDYYFFPGGHVEFGEKAEETLSRELQEELGVSAKNMKFIGSAENFFEKDGEHHEINIVFEASLSEIKSQSLEEHIDFIWQDVSKISETKILPEALKNKVVEWLENKEIFWSSQF